MIKIDKNLFWDVDFKKLDCGKNARFIIERVLLLGDKSDYNVLKNYYSRARIKKAAAEINYPDRKSANFWSFIFNLSNNKKCTKKLSTQKRSIFWNR